jgi:3-dehydroquinate synthase
MKTIRIEASRSYDVIIGAGLLDSAGSLSEGALGGKVRGVIVTDDRVYPLYGERLKRSLESAGTSCSFFVIKNGEASKNTDSLIRLLNYLAEEHLTRGDALFALGGGVVGDLAGFAAAVYLRGVRFVQIPTTVLAAVDSSVGGKTAVDLEKGKNLAGAFHQPSLVVCDTDTLNTLEPSIYSDGCAEVIKYGMIRSAELLTLLRTHVREQAEDVIARCVSIKRDVVAADEFDRGERAILNFGHTAGHAVEAVSRFGISHGSAVAIGMMTVTRAAVKTGRCPAECLSILEPLIELYSLPKKSPYTADELYESMLSDKKREGGFISMIVPDSVGHCSVEKMACSDVKAFIEAGIE